MSKVKLARAFADEVGTSFAKARRFVDDVGEPKAREQLARLRGGSDDALPVVRGSEADESSRLLTNRRLAILGGGGAAAGGGLLLKNQQDLAQSKAETQAAKDYTSTLKEVLEKDLTPEERQNALDALADVGNAVDGAEAKGFDPGDLVPDVPDIGGSIVPTLVLLVVGLFIISQLMDGDEEGLL